MEPSALVDIFLLGAITGLLWRINRYAKRIAETNDLFYRATAEAQAEKETVLQQATASKRKKTK